MLWFPGRFAVKQSARVSIVCFLTAFMIYDCGVLTITPKVWSTGWTSLVRTCIWFCGVYSHGTYTERIRLISTVVRVISFSVWIWKCSLEKLQCAWCNSTKHKLNNLKMICKVVSGLLQYLKLVFLAKFTNACLTFPSKSSYGSFFFFHMQVQLGQADIKCPITECNEHLDETTVLYNLPHDDIIKYKYFLELSRIDSSTKPCPQCKHFTTFRRRGHIPTPAKLENKYKVSMLAGAVG